MAHSLKTYQKLCTEFYDLVDHPRHVEALAFYMQKAQFVRGPILEPMCGTGRFLIPMLQAGLDVEGFDASAAMLEALRKRCRHICAQEAPVSLQFVQHFVSKRQYDLIFIPYGSFGLITHVHDAKHSLQKLYDHLAASGRLLVEIETVASVDPSHGVWQRIVNTREDGSKIALNFCTSYHEHTQIFQSACRYELLVNDHVEVVEEELFEQYIYQWDECERVLEGIGFSHIQKYPAYDSTRPSDKDTSIIIYECIK